MSKRISEYVEETYGMLRVPQTWVAVEALAEALIEKHQLSPDDVAAILINHPAASLPTKVVFRRAEP